MSERKTKTLQLRLTEAQYARAEQAAQGGSVAEIVRQALDRMLTWPCERCNGSGIDPDAPEH